MIFCISNTPLHPGRAEEDSELRQAVGDVWANKGHAEGGLPRVS